MSTLSLPPPTNGVTPAPAAPVVESTATEDFLAGIILPPPDIRAIADKTASFVAKNAKPEEFELKMLAREKTDSRFKFMNKSDAYHAYYQYSLAEERKKVKLGTTAAVEVKQAEEAKEEEAENGVKPNEPPSLEFLIESAPAMNAVDMDILRLTALFTARSGRQFISELSSREARNYQFDFLRPSHSLFGYFNRTVEQYTKLLMASKELQERLERRSGGSQREGEERLLQGRREVLKDAKERAEWQKWESGRQKELDDQHEAERIAIAEIDWQDFVVVSTVEFTEKDEAGLVELPPPMSIKEVENMTIAQKKMAAMIMEGREDEVEENLREEEEVEEVEMEEAEVVNSGRAEKERQKVIEIRTADSSAPMKIRKDYVPKSKRPAAKPAQVLTTFRDQQVPVEDLAEHIRIELIDPKWKEQKKMMDANRSASNLLPGGTDVSASLKAMAANRPDMFGKQADNEARKQEELAVRAAQKEREKNVWDGHAASKETVTDRMMAGANFDEQIEAIHRAKGLLNVEDAAGPQIGPAFTAPVVVEPLEPTTFTTGSTMSAAPQPNRHSLPVNPNLYAAQQQANYNQSMASSSQMLPPPQQLDYGYVNQQLPTQQTALQQQQLQEQIDAIQRQQLANPSAPIAASDDMIIDVPLPSTSAVGLPSRPPVAAPGEDLPALEGATSRAADDAPEGEPKAKRQMKKKEVDRSLLSEEDWLNSHPEPINLMIQLPEYSKKPEWGCDGSQIVLEGIPLTLLVGTLRDRIQIKIGLPIGKQRLSHNGNLLAVGVSLASLNIAEGDSLSLAVRADAKKK